jgi:hypothetical protein
MSPPVFGGYWSAMAAFSCGTLAAGGQLAKH